ncbi:MAG: hypothetical protein IPJ31_11910 [Bacteroidetes bacterium]|nr:hypothetical protein [Bacteroidota bacterium]
MYNPDRVQAPSTGDWDTAIQAVADAPKNYKPNEIAFLQVWLPDHLFDLVTDLAKATGMNAPVRFGALSMFEALPPYKAAENLFGQAGLPFFDVGGAQTVFSFGAELPRNLSLPVSYTRGFAGLRDFETKPSPKFVQFEPRMSATGANDHWVPLRRDRKLVALAIPENSPLKFAAAQHRVPSPV